MGKVALPWLLMNECNFDMWRLWARPFHGERTARAKLWRQESRCLSSGFISSVHCWCQYL